MVSASQRGIPQGLKPHFAGFESAKAKALAYLEAKARLKLWTGLGSQGKAKALDCLEAKARLRYSACQKQKSGVERRIAFGLFSLAGEGAECGCGGGLGPVVDLADGLGQ